MNQADVDAMIATQLAAPIYAAMLNAFLTMGDEGYKLPPLGWVETAQRLALAHARALMAAGRAA